MTCNPADLYHLPGGSVEEGAPADLVIFNPDETWTVDSFLSKSSNTPFKGMELYGKFITLSVEEKLSIRTDT